MNGYTFLHVKSQPGYKKADLVWKGFLASRGFFLEPSSIEEF